jgi:predicted HicB family RNase H-like nuclease
MSKLKQATLRLEPELQKKLQDEATRDRRSLAQFIRNLLSDAVNDRHQPKQRADAVRP